MSVFAPVLTLATFAATVLNAPVPPTAARWIVDPSTSLVWWQMSPNLGHLWATTCPADPSWRPGEGRTPGWSMRMPDRSTTGLWDVEDTVHVPLYPRRKVRHLCAEAVRGEILGDTTQWRGVHGTVSIRSEALVAGEAMRDVMMHEVLEADRYPEIVFTLDSVVGPVRTGDTVFATALGAMTVRDQRRPVTAAIRVFPDSGRERVLAKWRMPALVLRDLTPALEHLSLGLDTRVWKDFFLGADLELRPAGPTP